MGVATSPGNHMFESIEFVVFNTQRNALAFNLSVCLAMLMFIKMTKFVKSDVILFT